MLIAIVLVTHGCVGSILLGSMLWRAIFQVSKRPVGDGNCGIEMTLYITRALRGDK